MELLELFLVAIVKYAILIFEFIGVCIVIATGLKSFVNYLKRKALTRLLFAKGMSMGLEFMLCGEILRIVIVHSNAEILTAAFIIAIHAVLSFIIHWEISSEEKSHTNNPCG